MQYPPPPYPYMYPPYPIKEKRGKSVWKQMEEYEKYLERKEEVRKRKEEEDKKKNSDKKPPSQGQQLLGLLQWWAILATFGFPVGILTIKAYMGLLTMVSTALLPIPK